MRCVSLIPGRALLAAAAVAVLLPLSAAAEDGGCRVVATWLAAEKKTSYTCTCDSPCKGSITCKTGCYAFCEENPEGSGRHVCIKGCSSAEADDPAVAAVPAPAPSGEGRP